MLNKKNTTPRSKEEYMFFVMFIGLFWHPSIISNTCSINTEMGWPKYDEPVSIHWFEEYRELMSYPRFAIFERKRQQFATLTCQDAHYFWQVGSILLGYSSHINIHNRKVYQYSEWQEEEKHTWTRWLCLSYLSLEQFFHMLCFDDSFLVPSLSMKPQHS